MHGLRQVRSGHGVNFYVIRTSGVDGVVNLRWGCSYYSEHMVFDMNQGG